MRKLILITLIAIVLMSILTACGEADMEGILLDVSEESVLLSEDLSPEEYESIKDESAKKLQNEDVAGERENLSLIKLTYDQTEELSKGDQVEVWLKGDVFSSYPGQAEAKKIVVKE